MTAAQTRAVARQMIRENKSILIRSYAACLGLQLAIAAIGGIFSFNAALSMFWSLGSLFLNVPLTLGILHVNNMVYYRRPCRVKNLFDFFRLYHVSIKTIGVTCVLSMISSLLLIPVVIMMMLPFFIFFFTGLESFGFAMMLPTIIIGVLVIVAASLLLSSISMSVYYIALRNRSITFADLFSGSFRIGLRCLWKYFVLQLTFIGWSLLAALPAGIVMGGAAVVSSLGMTMSPVMIVLLILMVLGILLTLAAMMLVEVYLHAASTVFFNTAIDEYEKMHSDNSRAASQPVNEFRVQEPGSFAEENAEEPEESEPEAPTGPTETAEPDACEQPVRPEQEEPEKPAEQNGQGEEKTEE